MSETDFHFIFHFSNFQYQLLQDTVPPRKVLSMELVPPNRKKWLSTLVPPKTRKQPLQTSSTPSLADGLRFLRSCTVPLLLNFLTSLFRDLLEAGGGALATPQSAQPTWWWEWDRRKNLATTCDHIQPRSVPGQPPASSTPPKMCAGPQSIPLPFWLMRMLCNNWKCRINS